MKLYMSLIVFGSILFGYHTHAQQNLTVDNAIKIIWKMNYKNISELHKSAFEENLDNNPTTIQSIKEKISSMYHTLADRIMGKSHQTQILEMLVSESTATTQKNRLLKAIKESYEEYQQVQYSVAELLATILCLPICFPISLLIAYCKRTEHIQAIELKRAAIELNV